MTLLDQDSLADLEARATEHLDEVPHIEDDLDAVADAASQVPEAEGFVEPPLPPLRTGLVVGCSVAAAAVMSGGLFEGIEGRVYPVIAAACGVAVAAQASRRNSALWTNVTIIGGILATGLVLLLPAGIENLTRIGSILSEAKGASRVVRPPTEFLPGFRLIIGIVMATIGFVAGWVGIEFRRPALGLLIPLPAVAYGAISVPETEKVPSGIAAAALFVVGLAMLSSLQSLVDGSEQAPSLGYELRRVVRALPVLAVLVGVLALAAQSNFLFPKPRIDPARDSVAPKAVPLSEVEDRTLFTVTSAVTGPWRIGILDVYTDDEWRLPAFAESNLEKVPESGIVDPSLQATLTAEFRIAGLGGAVLPGLPSTVGIKAQGPRLSYDERTGNIRQAQGQIRPGLAYTVTAAGLPTEDDLRKTTELQADSLPSEVRRALELPAPPPAVVALLQEAPTANLWDRLDFVRRRFLQTVVAAGPGTPTAVPPSKVEDMLAGSKEGSPFEIVAGQAMLARWAGVPARIGYGFDGGNELEGGIREIRPRHGSSWLEAWYPGFKWLPILGQPAKAKSSLQTDAPTNPVEGVEADTDIAVQVYFPLRIEGKSPLYAQIRRIVLFALPVILLGVLLYLTWPAAWKSWLRRRARRRAAREGVQAEVAQAYAEFRDTCTDLGIRGRSLSPLAFLDVLVDDEEHRELAWLVTRVIWGDLRHARAAEHASDAIELARALRKRVAQGQPASIRLIASVSRLSVRHPFAPELAKAARRPLEEPSDAHAA